jgi:hypothetical protein
MHSFVRGFSERRPRTYGLFIFSVAISLGFLGQSIANGRSGFLVLMLAASFGMGGIYYLAFGARAHRWDRRFEERFFHSGSLSWQQASKVTAIGLALLCFTGVMYWLLR